MEKRKGISVIDVVENVDEGTTKLVATIYKEVTNDGGVKHVDIKDEVIEDTDLDLIIKRSKAAAAEFLTDYDKDKDEIQFSLSERLMGMVINNEIVNFKNNLIESIVKMRESVDASSNVMINLTDEQTNFIIAFGKACDQIMEKLK